MRGAADGRGFFRRNSAKPKVVKLEREKRRIPRADKRSADHLLDRARKRRNGDGIPDLEKNSFRPVGETIKLGVGVFDGDQGVETFDDSAFLDRANPQRKAASVFCVK